MGLEIEAVVGRGDEQVVAVQDGLLSLGVTGVSDWLKAAERP